LIKGSWKNGRRTCRAADPELPLAFGQSEGVHATFATGERADVPLHERLSVVVVSSPRKQRHAPGHRTFQNALTRWNVHKIAKTTRN